MNQLTVRWKKVGEALLGVGILFIALPLVGIIGLALIIWVFTDYWRVLIFFSFVTAWFMLSLADQEPPKPKGTAYRVLPSSPKGVPAAGQKPLEPQSQEEKDKVLEVVRLQYDHWHKISMFLLAMCGVLATLLGLAIKGIIAPR